MHSVLMLTVAGVSAFATAALAQAPAAVIEDVKGNVSGVEFMDYVAPGKVIKLGPQDSIVIGYMKSCWRESIVGGTVIVGTEQSVVHHGDVSRHRVACDAGRIQLTDKEASQSAATSFRSIEVSHSTLQPVAEPQITIHGLSPVVEVKSGGALVIKRLDGKGERREIAIDARTLVQGKFYDFATSRISLHPGGNYVASLGSRRTFFKVDPQAKAGATPIIGRLVRLD